MSRPRLIVRLRNDDDAPWSTLLHDPARPGQYTSCPPVESLAEAARLARQHGAILQLDDGVYDQMRAAGVIDRP